MEEIQLRDKSYLQQDEIPIFVRSEQRNMKGKRSNLALLFWFGIFLIFIAFAVFAIYFINIRHTNRPGCTKLYIVKENTFDKLEELLKDPEIRQKVLDVLGKELENEKTTVERYIKDHTTKSPNEDWDVENELIKLISFNNDSVCLNVKDDEKFDCYPDAPVTEKQCLSRGCCWKALKQQLSPSVTQFPPLSTPYCYYPLNYVGYQVRSIIRNYRSISAELQRKIPSGFPKDVGTVNVTVYFYHKDTVRIKITDVNNDRFEVHLPEDKDFTYANNKSYPNNRRYDANITNNGELVIKRLYNGEVIFHTNLSRLVFSDQFLQLSSYLPSSYIYGLGTHKAPLLRSVNWKRYTLFNRDRSPVEGRSSYGSHPFYLNIEKDGSSNGVILLNSNAMDVILQPTPAITYRPIGGIFDFFIFLGEKPDTVIQQYTNIIGTTFMPPYWSLGFHICKYNYSTVNHTKEVLNRNQEVGIPIDTQWNDIDYMERNNDFTYDKTRFEGLPEFVQELHNQGMHYVPMFDPGVSGSEPAGTYPPYDDGIKMDIFVKNSTGNVFLGHVWNDISTAFPDFLHPNVTKYWIKQFQNFHSQIEFDGAWIDMNEPSNFLNGQINGCPNSSFDSPPYTPGGIEPLCSHTLCMSAKHYTTSHYNAHNLYALMEAVATNKALRSIRNKRPFIISRASFPGLGHFAGNWDGDITSTWDSFRWTIPSILNFNMFGIPMVGADICGFAGNTTVELCARWSALGAFYPFSRNHNSNDTIEQDPRILGPQVVAAAKNALNTRYFLLPYLYTLFYKSHAFGETVVRPLFFEFPTDPKTYAIDTQFLWGNSLMILPVLNQSVTTVTSYLPNDTWYDFYTGEKYTDKERNITLNAPTDIINLVIRGGSILPAQFPSNTTTASRLNDFCLIVALKNGTVCTGQLYWDDGDSLNSLEDAKYSLIQFLVENNELVTFVVMGNYTNMPNLGNVRIMGFSNKPTTVNANGHTVKFDYDSMYKVLSIPNLILNLLKPNKITWT